MLGEPKRDQARDTDLFDVDFGDDRVLKISKVVRIRHVACVIKLIAVGLLLTFSFLKKLLHDIVL